MASNRALRVGLLATDNREHCRNYGEKDPLFGAPVEALLQGFLEFPEEVEIHILSVAQKPLRAPPRLGRNLFYHSLLVPKIGWLRTGYQGCIRAVRTKARELDLELLHGEGTERDCAIEAVTSGLPNLVTLHGNMRAMARVLRARPFSYHWFHSFLESYALRRTNLVLCNSSYTESLVRPLNPKVLRMPNPVREAFYSPLPPRPSTPLGKLQFLVVGLVASHKQSLEILRTLRVWAKTHSRPFHCLWVGALSGQEQYVRSFTDELSAARKEGWADHQPHMSEVELREAMDARDVLIHIPKEEAFGLVVAEAMLRGMEIIAGRTGGLVDFQTLYPGLRMVDPDLPQNWLEALNDLTRRPPTRIARQSWDFMLFHPREIARRHCQAYHQLLHAASAVK